MAKSKKNKIAEILRERIRIIDESAPSFISSVEKTQRDILSHALELVGDLDTENGIIKATKRNFALIEKIDRDLKKTFLRSDYVKAVRDLTGNMDTVKELTDKYFKSEFGTFKSKDAQAVFVAKKEQAADLLIGTSAMNQNFFQPISAVIIDSVGNQASYKDLLKSLKTTVTGNAKRDGKLKRYARQIASDVFSTTERNYTRAVAESVGAEFVRYVGGLLPTTRCFCDERNEKYFHVREVEEWGKGNISAGGLSSKCGFPWGGMYVNTNEYTIFTWVGGYECQHSLLPVSEFSVPLEVLERAMAEGYYEPTAAVREILGL